MAPNDHEKSALDVALEILAQAGENQGFRAAASRAYFAVFQHFRGHPDIPNETWARKGTDHGKLLNFLKDDDGKLFVEDCLLQLNKLRGIRNHADYDLLIPFTREDADAALARASLIMKKLAPK